MIAFGRGLGRGITDTGTLTPSSPPFSQREKGNRELNAYVLAAFEESAIAGFASAKTCLLALDPGRDMPAPIKRNNSPVAGSMYLRVEFTKIVIPQK